MKIPKSLLTLLTVIAIGLIVPPTVRVQTTEADSPSKQLEKLFIADQSDPRPNGTPEEAQATEARGKKRREQVAEILAKGGVQSGEDYFRASAIFQHSLVPEDHLMAHILATIAGYKGHKRARWLSAAALDAYLQSVDKPQIFGTVYLRSGQRKPFDQTFLSDTLRKDSAYHHSPFRKRISNC